MKLRQKLAVALASAMVITSVPVVTMASSTNTVTKEMVVAKNDIFNDTTTAPQLTMKLDDTLAQGTTFYLNLTGSEWLADVFKDGNGAWVAKGLNAAGELVETTDPSALLEVKPTSKTELQVKVAATAGAAAGNTLKLPLLVKVTGEEAVVSIDPNNQLVTKGTFTFATTADAKGKVTVGTLTNVYEEGELAGITIEEPFAGVFKAKAAELEKAGKTHLTLDLEIENKEYEILSTNDIKISFGKGFEHVALTAADLEIEENKYGDIVGIKIPTTVFTTDLANANKGNITISGIDVKSTVKEPTLGEFKVTLGGDIVKEAEYVVANVIKHGAKITLKDNKVVEFAAGRDSKVNFTIEENVKDSISGNRTMDITLENGYFGKYDAKSSVKDIDQFKAMITLPSKVELVDVELNKDNEFVGFTVKVLANQVDSEAIDKFTFEAPLCADLSEEDAEIKMNVEGRAIEGQEPTEVVAKVKAPVTVKSEKMTVKVGLQKQVGGKVTLTETDKAMFKRGDIVLAIPAEQGVKFTKAPEVKVTDGDLRIDTENVSVKYNSADKAYEVRVPVSRESKEASTIEIEGFEVTVDRTVPEGGYELAIAGNALVSSHVKGAEHTHGELKVEDFFTVGTPNTEDIASNGLKKGSASFTINSKKYTLNGEEKEMDAAPYAADGRTMVPVRYVSEAFGIAGKDVLFSSGTVTMFAGNRTIQLKIGSNIAIVNGVSIPMDQKVVAKDGRTYIPMGELGRILGVSVTWDGTTKTATFTNK